MDNQYEFMVCTRCMTYNQELFIEDAMNGFAMQQTSFPFVTAIVDDASTDNNAKVITNYLRENFDLDDKSVAYEEEKEYGHIFFTRHKINKNCFFAVILLKENQYSQKKSKLPYFQQWLDKAKYHAFCEGDDFWIDRHKLQCQVDFLETHPDYKLVFHNALIRFQDKDTPDRVMREFSTGDFNTAQIFEKWQLPFASVVCVNEIQDCDEIQKLRKVSPGSFTYFIAASMRGKVYGISECWSIYRKNKGGVSLTFSPSFILKVDLGFAYATGDISTKRVMDRKASKRLKKHIAKYYKKDEEAIKMVDVTNSFNKDIFRKARWMYICSIPSIIWTKFKKIFR